MADDLKKMGVSMLDREGFMRNLSDILRDVEEVYHKIQGRQEPPLLTIELQDETAVPKVFYDGEEITNKVMVSFDWETRTDEYGGTSYNIEHIELVNGEPIRKGVGLARGKYAHDQQ